MKYIGGILTLSLLLVSGVHCQRASEKPSAPPRVFCKPGDKCWPTDDDMATIRKMLSPNARFVPRGVLGYEPLRKVNTNTAVLKYPAFIAEVRDEMDVKHCLDFTEKHNMRVTIVSSGHSYIGRNTADDSLQINVHQMKHYTVEINCRENEDGCIIVQPGCQFGDLYKALDRYDRVMVGGSAPTVSVSGWMMGGGHSPMSRNLGLGVDNVLEVDLVIANGSFVKATENATIVSHPNGTRVVTNDTSLFWALRGGGGGTYGVVTSIKFKLHRTPEPFVVTGCSLPAFVNGNPYPLQYFLSWITQFSPTLPDRYGGYFLYGANSRGDHSKSTITLILLHMGNWTQAEPWVKQIHGNVSTPDGQTLCESHNASTFYDYQKIISDPIYFDIYIANNFIQPKLLNGSGFTDVLVEAFNRTFHSGGTLNDIGGTMAHIGGQRSYDSDLPVHPGFRSAIWSFTIGTSYIFGYTPNPMAVGKATVDELNKNLTAYGNGQYFNECQDPVPNWRTQFFDTKYSRLLAIKKRWDPKGLFYCKMCVGDGDY